MFTLAATAALLGGWAQAQALPIPLTGGLISVAVFRDFSPIISLDGPGFHFESDGLRDMFRFTSPLDLPAYLLPYGTEIELSALATLYAGGSITLTTPRVVVASLFSIPFSLSGTIQGQEVFGSGIVTARFTDFGAPGIPETQLFGFESAAYEIATPEPGTLLLLAAGSLFVVRKRTG